jgi:hypothetical protein
VKTLQIDFERRPDGSVVTNYVRSDGTRTWEHHRDRRAVYFPWHDLIHFAVETRLREENGFYGLVAEGWNIGDMDGKSSRGRLPAAAILVEHLTGLFAGELSTGHELNIEDFNLHLANAAAQLQVTAPVISPAEIADIRSEVRRLQNEWADVPSGGRLSLTFRLERRQVANVETVE